MNDTTLFLPLLIGAALLEVVGDAAIRHGLLRSIWWPMALGMLMLAVYGLIVNVNRVIDFGRLMGIYIVVFFVVSQVSSFVVFGERPTVSLLVGGGLIIAGGLVIHFGASASP